ncbi:hypothetical protein D3C87_1792740 [compost metagenome]
MREVDRLQAHASGELEHGIALEIAAAVLVGRRQDRRYGDWVLGEGVGESLLDGGRVHGVSPVSNDGRASAWCSSPPSEFHVHISFSEPDYGKLFIDFTQPSQSPFLHVSPAGAE